MRTDQIDDLLAQLDDMSDGMEDVMCGVGIHQLGDGEIHAHVMTDVPCAVLGVVARALAKLLREGVPVAMPIDALDLQAMARA